MNKKVYIFLCALNLFIPSFGYATKGVETFGQNSASENSPVNNNPAVKDSADKTSSDNAIGEMMSYMMSAMEIGAGTKMISKGTASCPACNGALIAQGSMMVGMGIMSAAQAVAHGETKDQAANTAAITDGFSFSTYIPRANGPMDENNPDSLINKEPTVKSMRSNLIALEKSGIYNSKNGTIKIDGKTFKVTDFSSPASMAAAGIPKPTIDSLMSVNQMIEKKAEDKLEKLKIGSLTKEAGFEEGGGRAGNSLAAQTDLSDQEAFESSGNRNPTSDIPEPTMSVPVVAVNPGSNKYRAYLPGGEKDPSKAIAGQEAWLKEVTSQGGRSNWEKIRIRYAEKLNTFIGN